MTAAARTSGRDAHAPRWRRGMAAAAAWLACSALALGQDGGDPREVGDPRDASDPRPASDPREADEAGRPLDDPREPATGTDLIAELLAAKDHEGVRLAMRDDPWSLLPYIDGYCAEWLDAHASGQAETEAGRAKLTLSEETGRLLARLADETLRDTGFVAYVEQVYAWNEDQQAAFHEAQDHFDAGMQALEVAASADEALRAMGSIERSLRTARDLGDTWGRTMALAALAQAQFAVGYVPQARASVDEALEFGYPIRDLDSVWSALETRVEIAIADGDRVVAESALADQYLLAREIGDEEVAETVLDQLEELIGLFEDGTFPTSRVGVPPPPPPGTQAPPP